MQIDQYQWQVNGKNIYGATFSPGEEPEAVIVFIHGLGEHIRRYDDWFRLFCGKKLAVIAADHHGHGQSEGRKGHYANYCEAMDFVGLLFEKAKQIFGNKPLLLYGHSMGGNIALNYLLRRQPSIKGAILSAPWIKLQKEPRKILVRLATLVAKILPQLTLNAGIKREQLTTNNDELERYKQDNLIHGRITLSTFLNLHHAAQYALNNVYLVNIPILLMHGKADPIADYNGSVKLSNKSKMIDLKLFDNFLHEIHKAANNHKVFDAIEIWLKSVL